MKNVEIVKVSGGGVARALLLVGSGALACCTAWADARPVYALNASGDNHDNACSTPSHWTDYSAEAPVNASASPREASAAGVEYVITNSYRMRTMNNSYANIDFYGHLTVGSVDSPGSILNKRYGTAILYRGGLTVVNGQYLAAGSGSGTAEFNKARIGGRIQVQSPVSAPFAFGGDSAYGVDLSADLTGDEGTGIVIGSPGLVSDVPSSTLSGDNAAYLGSIHFASAGNGSNLVASATALGGAPSALVSDAVKISTKGCSTLAFASSVGTCRIPATRGILFDGFAGGAVYPRTFQLSAEAGADVEIQGPIHANGACSNGRNELTLAKIGTGTITLSGAFTRNPDIADANFKLAVSEGRLVLGSATAIALTNGLSASVWAKSPSAAPFDLAGYTVGAGAGFVVRHEKSAVGTFVLDASSTIEATPISVKLETDEQGYDAYEVCVLKVPTTVRVLSAEDFVDVDATSAYDCPKTTFRVEEADGMQSVWLCRAANDTIAHLTFEDDFRSHVRAGTLDTEPEVTLTGSTLSEDVKNVRVSLRGDREATLHANAKSLSVGKGALTYRDPDDLLAWPSQTIEFFIKADPQNRYQTVMRLENGSATNPTAWAFLFDNGVDGGEHDKLKVSFSLVKGEGEEPANSTNPLTPYTVGNGRWHHIAYTFAPNADEAWKTDVAMYVDYKQVAAGTADGRVNLTPSVGGRFVIAVDERAANRFDGLLDEVRISRGVLTPDQFLQLRREGAGLLLIVR